MINRSKKVSVIVPVYNAEKTLKRAIQSIVNQSYANLEIILVNDGSTDQSLKICKDYAELDKRIYILNQNNAGVSTARNKGLDFAKGDFCCFIDSDDWIESDFIEQMVYGMIFADCVITGYTKELKDKKIYSRLITKIYDMEYILNYDISPLFVNGFIHPCWNKLFKLSIINKNNIRFISTLNISEDSIFCMNYLMYCKKISVMDFIAYHYCIDEAQESLSKKVYPDIFEIYEQVFYCLKALLERGHCPEDLKESILIRTVYPQIYISALKIAQSREMTKKEKKYLLQKGLKLPYSDYVLSRSNKYIKSKYESFFWTLIILKKYKLIGALLKWYSKIKQK